MKTKVSSTKKKKASVALKPKKKAATAKKAPAKKKVVAKKPKRLAKTVKTKAPLKKKTKSRPPTFTSHDFQMPRVETHMRSEPSTVARSEGRRVVGHRNGYYSLGFLTVGLGLFFGAYQYIRGGSQSVTPVAVAPQTETEVKPEAKTEAPTETRTETKPEARAERTTEQTIQKTEVAQTQVAEPADTDRGDSGVSSVLVDEFKKAQSMKFAERINYWSSLIEKSTDQRRLIEQAFGAYHIEDNVPLIPNKYDCTTYVETVAALAKSENGPEFVKNLIAIRYKNGQSTYDHRNHFPEADWIPNNEKVKILTDVTHKIAENAGTTAQVEKKQIDRKKWLGEQIEGNTVSRGIASVAEKEWSEPVRAKVSYVQIGEIKKVIGHIPSGTVLNLVHKDDQTHPVLITHQGFVIREGGKVLLRHASRGGRIRTNDLYSYLHDLVKKQDPNSNWPLIGVNLIQINDSTSASSALSDSM